MIALAMALFAQQSTETHIRLTGRAERLAQAITSEVQCTTLGFAVDLEGIKAEGVTFLNDAVSTRMRMESAQDMVTSSVRRDEADLDRRAAAVKRKSDLPAFTAWWRGRCDGLVRDPRYAAYYKAPAKRD